MNLFEGSETERGKHKDLPFIGSPTNGHSAGDWTRAKLAAENSISHTHKGGRNPTT